MRDWSGRLLAGVVLIVLVAGSVAGCQPEGRIFQVTLRTAGIDPLPVTLTDTSGLVTAITQADIDPVTIGIEPALRDDPDRANASIVTWLGGGCDQDATLWFHVLNGAYILNVTIHEKVGLGCTAVGVPRAVRIESSRPVPAASITVAGG